MKGRDFSLTHEYGGKWVMSFALSPDSVQDAKNLINGQKPRDYEITVRVYTEKRSLTANAYFHKLVNLIAARIGSDDESVKKHLVCLYSPIAERNGIPVSITIPRGTSPDDYYPYTIWADGDEDTDTYYLKKQTRGMTRTEFSRLTDGAVQEAKELGIETLPRAELERLYAQVDHCNKDT